MLRPLPPPSTASCALAAEPGGAGRVRAPGPRAMSRLLATVGAGGLALALGGCGCNKEYGDPVVYLDGTTTGSHYESAPIAGPWLDFPGGRTYRFVHGLGRVPAEVTAYLSFEERDPKNFSTSSGNAALFEEVTDAYIDVHNDACPDYFVRVVATAPVPDGDD